MAVADRVGVDGMGNGGVVGYFCYLALQYPAAYCKLLSRMIDIQESTPSPVPRINSTPTSANLFGPTVSSLKTL